MFRAEFRAGVWSVTRDRVFYGDYLTREQALSSACSGARAVEARGGAARVIAPPGETVVAHEDHNPTL